MKLSMKKINNPILALAILVTSTIGCSASDNVAVSKSEAKVAVIILAEDSRKITNELQELLHDPEPRIRGLASRAVGRIGIDSAPLSRIDSLLMPNLHDSVIEVSAMTAFAYGLLPNDSALANKLIEYAFTAPAGAALNAIASGGRLADSANTQVIQKLMILLNHPQPSYRSRAALALLYCNAKSTSLELTRVALSDKTSSVRDTALYVLARLGAAQAKDVYLAYISDTKDDWHNSYHKSLALRGLVAVADTALAPRVISFLKAENVNLRSQAIVTLGALKCQLTKEALTKVVTDESDSRLAAQALNALAGFSGERDDKLAEKVLFSKKDLGMQLAVVTYLAGSFKGVLSSLLDSTLRHGSPQLLSAFFDGVNQDVSKKGLYELCEEMLHSPQFHASGPAYYSAYELYEKLELKPNDWMNAKVLWEIIVSDTDFVIKTAMLEYAGTRKSPWFFDVALPLARLIESDEHQIGKYEYQGVYRALLTATESYLGEADKYFDNTPKQTKLNVREIFELCLQAPDFIVSKNAAKMMKKYFKMDVDAKINKPQPEYDAEELSKRLAIARVEHKSIVIVHGAEEIKIELDYDAAPMNCLNILALIENCTYTDLVFHRVIPNFVAQGGDPLGDGWGGPGYSIRCEYSQLSYVRGAVGIATSGKDTGGSQFFITLSAQPHLEARYTVFGKVIDGLQNIDAIKQGDLGTVSQEGSAN